MRSRALPLLIAALTAGAAGCGSSSAPSHPIARWTIQAPSFAPPEPQAHAGTPPGRPAPATAPTAAPVDASAAPDTGAPTDAQVRAELKSVYGDKAGQSIDVAGLTRAGLAIPPPTAPARLVAIIQAANAVARKPYVYGGGHGRFAGEVFSDNAYDCSGSVSYALAAAGLITSPMDSSTLARFGKPGAGRWVTIYANGGHAWMTVAGLRFDTSGRDKSGSRWQADGRGTGGFTVRHPPGL
jgi:cell wall-associated NlpC family hydrolase